jgi:glycylpeptide N-tetradecanoyltransferase
VPQTFSGSSSAMMAMEEGPIDPIKTVEEVRQEPLPLPSGFEWSLIDIKNDVQVSCACHTLYG